MKKWLAFLLALALLASGAVAQEAAVELTDMHLSGNLNPFFAENDDALLLDFICEPLLATTALGEVVQDGMQGLTTSYKGSESTTLGLGSAQIVHNDDGSLDVHIALREDILFSDGHPADIDDLIFTIYVLADPAYDGPNTFAAQPVLGMAEYTASMPTLGELMLDAGRENAAFDLWDAQTQQAFWADVDAAGEAMAQALVDTIMEDYLSDESAAEIGKTAAEVQADPQLQIQLGMTMWGYGHAYFPGAGIADYWQAILAEYGGDALQAAATESPAGDLFAYMEGYAEKYGAVVPRSTGMERISGITRTGDYSLTLRCAYDSGNLLYALADLPLLPLHHYGDEAAYDYKNGRFGFTMGDLEAIRAVNEPIGCGAYVLAEHGEGTALLRRNPRYFNAEGAAFESIRISN